MRRSNYALIFAFAVVGTIGLYLIAYETRDWRQPTLPKIQGSTQPQKTTAVFSKKKEPPVAAKIATPPLEKEFRCFVSPSAVHLGSNGDEPTWNGLYAVTVVNDSGKAAARMRISVHLMVSGRKIPLLTKKITIRPEAGIEPGETLTKELVITYLAHQGVRDD